MQIDRKWKHLTALLREMKYAVLAYSGGVDSSLLLRAAAEVLGPNLIAVTAISPTYPPGELEQAKEFARNLGIRHRIIESHELEKEVFVRNDRDRCFHCKHELFVKLREIANLEGIEVVLDGTNIDDGRDFRPGMRAARELGVRNPLAETGFTKGEIREKARQLGLKVWDKPALACLSSRIPYGTRISRELLTKIQSAEDAVRSFGIRHVRVRHHGDTARIEVARNDFPILTTGDAPHLLATRFKQLGYTYVCLDLEGYRTGSLNEKLDDRNSGTEVTRKEEVKA